jgi:hypothetical protein
MIFFAIFDAGDWLAKMNRYQRLLLQKLLVLVRRKSAACASGQNSTEEIDNKSHYDGVFT